MIVKTVQDEDYVNFKLPSMFICTTKCSGKCWKELGLEAGLCQNSNVLRRKNIEIDNVVLCKRYEDNPLTEAICIGGLEPMDTFEDVLEFIRIFRKERACSDWIVIYTGYKEEEIPEKISELKRFENIIVKFGRYDPINFPYPKNDPILGVRLSTSNQYAKVLKK